MKPDYKKNMAAILFFASFMFLQFVILRMGNQAGRGFLPAERQENVYIFLQVFVIGGLLLHAVLYPVLKKESLRRAAAVTALFISALCTGAMFFAPAASAFYLAVTFIGAFFLGTVAGAVYLKMAAFSAAGLPVGVCMGVGYSAALLLQFTLQLRWQVPPALWILSLAAFASLAVLLAARPKEAPPAPGKRVPAPKRISACIIAAALILFTAFYSGYIHHLQVASGYTSYNVYTWPRLLMIPGMLLFGTIGDVKHGRYLPLFTLCFSVIALLNAVLAGRIEMYWLNMCLYYVALSAAVSYYNLTFWKIAPGTGNPALWAAAGRAIDSVIVIPLCLVPFTEASAGVILSLNIAALAVVIILMALNGDFNLVKAPAEPCAADPLTAVRERYGLTPGEARVFRELVLSEDKQAAIAEKLSVKVRTVQANVTAIYRKTGVSTRAGLVQLYRDLQDQ